MSRHNVFCRTCGCMFHRSENQLYCPDCGTFYHEVVRPPKKRRGRPRRVRPEEVTARQPVHA